MGMISHLVNILVKRRLPQGHRETERVEDNLRGQRATLRAETDSLIEELVTPTRDRKGSNGTFHD